MRMRSFEGEKPAVNAFVREAIKKILQQSLVRDADGPDEAPVGQALIDSTRASAQG
jgi:hypothetical protein